MTDTPLFLRIPITLTEEQGRLYRESPTFKAGVDAFIQGVVPHFLEGLAQHATRHDADIQSRIAAAYRVSRDVR